MEAYTIEDVELLRRKSGMSYQEAVALLEFHNGNLARALIDLERNGRLKEEAAGSRSTAGVSAGGNTRKHGETREKAINLLQKLYRCRAKVHKGDVPVLNVSVLYAGAALLFAPHITIAGIIIAMILGYRFSFSQMDADFASDNLKQTVKNAAENAKAAVNSMVKTFNRETAKTAETAAPAAKTEEAKTETADEPRVPTIQVPVQAETREGSVQMDEDQDGYASVTIGGEHRSAAGG